MTKLMQFFFHIHVVENTVEKCWLPAFDSFPTMLSKGLSPMVVHSWHWPDLNSILLKIEGILDKIYQNTCVAQMAKLIIRSA